MLMHGLVDSFLAMTVGMLVWVGTGRCIWVVVVEVGLEVAL